MDGKARRNRGKDKHFSHTSNSRCHGEGPFHYQLKVLLHQFGGEADAMTCPDTRYMFERRLTPAEMYSDPTHPMHSHTYHE